MSVLGRETDVNLVFSIKATLGVLDEIIRDEDVSTEDRLYAAAILLENAPSFMEDSNGF